MLEYRGSQCPVRGPGLSHTQNGRDGSPCIECGTLITSVPPRGIPPSATQASPADWPMINVDERLRALGLAGTYRSIAGSRDMEPQNDAPAHTEDTLIEPRAITGNGPQGSQWGLGRGSLTPRDKQRIVQTVEYRAYLAAHGGGEEE